MKTAVVTVDLGFGDSGKGACVERLCADLNADLVVRYSGGAQAGHNVVLSDGRRHCFSQWGSGTFLGVPTYLYSPVIINLVGIRNECQALKDSGVPDPMSMLTVHPNCLVTTPFHVAVNHIKELQNRHGSCGMGIGEARRYWLDYGRDAIFASDLVDRYVLVEKLRLMQQRLWNEFLLNRHVVPADMRFNSLNVADIASRLYGLASSLRIWPQALSGADTVVFEAAQGVLIDETYGCHPHTTWSTVTAQHAMEMIYEYDASLGVKTNVTGLGITRSYHCRHGAGPLPTYDKELTKRTPDPSNPTHKWQGSMRMGWLDLNLIEYAIESCGMPLDGLVLNHLDQLPSEAYVYESAGHKDWFNLSELFDRRKAYTNSHDLIHRLEKYAPVVMTGFGPTREDREWRAPNKLGLS